ncbi:TauD/TfdA family dioxygenase [Kribbella sp. NPDC051587]|uniref:TauD/TfdA family dioxygenase n=1 Tax=Kribbella sp. NPDC051587 TaxID=3364119 RepID=UPI0037B7AFAE
MTTATTDALHAEDLAGLAEIAARLADGSSVDEPGFVAKVRRSWEDVPVALRSTIRSFRRHSGPDGRLVVTGLPLGDVPDTPKVAGSVQREATVPAVTLLLFAHGLGDPGSFLAEKSGALVQDVVPVRGQEHVQGNVGSAELTFHTENAFHPHRPDHVMLLCLRPDHDEVAELRTACVRRLLPQLPADARKTLHRNEFLTSAPPSFGGAAAGTAHSILSGDADDPDLCYDQAATRATTAAGEVALAVLNEAIREHADGVRLRHGDIAIVDNRVALHGRSSFVPRYDGRDRWLQRGFAFSDLRRSRDHRPGDGEVLTQ